MYWNIKSETFCNSYITATSFDTKGDAEKYIDNNFNMSARYTVVEEGVPNVQTVL